MVSGEETESNHAGCLCICAHETPPGDAPEDPAERIHSDDQVAHHRLSAGHGGDDLDALAPAVSPATLKVLVEEVSKGQILTPSQVKNAECEFIKLVNEEKTLPCVSC